MIIKHLDHIYQKNLSKSSSQSQDIGRFGTTDNILHTFDVKIIPYDNIITRDHALVGLARIYFTTTDLYIAPFECKHELLKITISNQCPSKDKHILCIPFFTIRHYGNHSKIFLIELGKSNYGNGEIHMSCLSSSLASTIHLLVSPVIEERPLALSSAFQNQLLTNKRREKSRFIQPPIQLTQELTEIPKRSSIESITKPTQLVKSRSLIGFFRKLITKSQSFNQTDSIIEQQTPKAINKFFELNIDETKFSTIPLQTIEHSSPTDETYLDMGSTIRKTDEHIESNDIHGDICRESTATVDIGVNTIITIAPHVHSAMLVGTTVHIIAEQRTDFPIGQRSFTSPASIMEPFKAQLSSQTDTSTSPLLTYAFVTFNNQDSTINCRLNSDLSVLSLTHQQQQPSNMFSFNHLLSSSSSSHIFRTLSFPANTNADNSNGNILIFDEQPTNYLLGPPPSSASQDDELTSSNEIEQRDTTADKVERRVSIGDLPAISQKDEQQLPPFVL